MLYEAGVRHLSRFGQFGILPGPKTYKRNKLYASPDYSFDALHFHTIPARSEAVPQAGKADFSMWPEVLPEDHPGLIL
jgi:hypothetical protein